MTYARARLWLGISTVGFWVVLAVSALVWHLPARFLPAQPSKISTDLPALLAVFGLYALLSLPWDLWGGLILPRRHGRSPQTLGPYFGSWVRGAVLQVFVLTLTALAILSSARAGGIVGLPGRERLILPASWLSGMGSGPAAAHLVRRREALRSRARARGRGVPEEPLIRALALFDQMLDDEPARAKWVERIFHPLPSVENRREQLRHPHHGTGAWNAARLALFLSWGTLGLLSRAVHSNAGRPELWVLLPAD